MFQAVTCALRRQGSILTTKENFLYNERREDPQRLNKNITCDPYCNLARSCRGDTARFGQRHAVASDLDLRSGYHLPCRAACYPLDYPAHRQ